MQPVAISVVIAATILGVKWMDVGIKRSPPQVDTVYVHSMDTIVTRAKDTMQIVVKDVGPLTEQDLARLICRDQVYGDKKRDHFGYNTYGMIVCPVNGLKDPNEP